MAMNPSKILYDMDSEDEQWISRTGKAFQTQETCCTVITDDIFEKCMDMLEKFAFARQNNHFTVVELEKLMAGVVQREVITSIYQHWQQKRKRTGMPLIRHLQEKFYGAGHRHATVGDQGGVHTFVRDEIASYPNCSRKYIPLTNDASGFDNHPKLYSKKSKRIGVSVPRCNLHTLPSNHKRPGKRNRVQRRDMEFPDWPGEKRHRSESCPGKGTMLLGVQDSDEFRMHEALAAAKHTSMIAVSKRTKAQILFSKADFAINVAASFLSIASARKASYCPTG